MDNDMRNELLAELIDQMHGRLAEKHYPSEKPKEEEIIAAIEEPTEAPKEVESEELSEEDLMDLEAAAPKE